jgi:hypothetical protein
MQCHTLKGYHFARRCRFGLRQFFLLRVIFMEASAITMSIFQDLGL